MKEKIKSEKITKEEKNLLFENLKNDLKGFNNYNNEEEILKDEFLDKFKKCEILCKTIMKCYRKIPYDEIKTQKLYWPVIEKSIDYLNGEIAKDNLKLIFGEKNQDGHEIYAKEIRNVLEHQNSSKYIEILKKRKKILFSAMDKFIDEIKRLLY